MRRQILLLLILMTGAIVLLSASHAAGQDEAPPTHEPILVAPDPDAPPIFGPLTGVWQESVEVELQEVPDPHLTEAHASDTCSDAPSRSTTK